MNVPQTGQDHVASAGLATIHLVPGGLVAHFKNEMTRFRTLPLNIYYRPSQGRDESAEITMQFLLEH